MRVAFAHYGAADDISGVTSWLLGLALALNDQGVTVAVHLHDLCPPGGTSPLEMGLRQHGIEVYRSLPSRSLRKDVDATLAFLNTWQPDVFLPQCQPHHYVAAAIAGRAGLPWALTLHSDDPDYWAVAGSLPPPEWGGLSVCVSAHIQQELARRGGEPQARVIPYGVAIPERTTHHRSDPFRVVYSGRLWEHQKRASLVVESLIRACRRSDGSLTATVIGDGYSRQQCEQRVRETGLADRITFAGRLSLGGVQKILLESQAILLMSDFEGLPVALLEAMAAGVVPVVRLIPSGIPEVVREGETGLLVSEDPDEAASALIALARDPVLWQRCSSASRTLVQERFGADHCHAQWLDLLQQMHTTTQVRFPIQGLHGLRLHRLSPLMKAGYRRDTPWAKLRLRQRLYTRVARLKARIRSLLPRS